MTILFYMAKQIAQVESRKCGHTWHQQCR